jgi:hypothetical protein
LTEEVTLSTITTQADLLIKKGVDEMWNNNWDSALKIF